MFPPVLLLSPWGWLHLHTVMLEKLSGVLPGDFEELKVAAQLLRREHRE